MRRLHELFAASAELHGQRTAVRDSDAGAEINYRDLLTEANSIGELLQRHGVGPGDRVGIYAPKSIGVVAAIFGILRCGAAYVPVDSTAPIERASGILADCGVAATIAEEALAESLSGESGLSISGERTDAGPGLVILHDGTGSPRGAAPAEEELAYILYTSGSTGKPKGVMHTHTSALNFLDWCSETFRPANDDRFSSHAPLHFDLSVLDIFVPLLHGASMVLIGEEAGKQPLRLAPLIAEHRISVWYSTPTILRLLVEHGKLERHDFSALRLVLFAGEVFPIKHLCALRAAWDHPDYFNLYGPTETNVCTGYKLPDGSDAGRTEPFPIGRPCSGDQAIVVDRDGAGVRPGVEGELLIHGGSVMLGYWNQPGLTAEAFHTDETGVRWYRTGDVVRQDAGGDYVFLGRRDRMVKRRGYRVELGEIEAALYRHPSVSEVAVVALPDEDRGVAIRSFVNWSGDERPSLIEMKRFCSTMLPLYMIPDRFTFLPALPRTSTDKIDYRELMELG